MYIRMNTYICIYTYTSAREALGEERPGVSLTGWTFERTVAVTQCSAEV